MSDELAQEPTLGFRDFVRLHLFDPEIREAVLGLSKYCGIVTHHPDGKVEMCDQPADVVVLEDGLPLGLCPQHVITYQQNREVAR